jgi:RHH-type proline utilization regulon transcriptional repressor/proline dehydrogenase/delta 1-pyrroline-5-carboxylate dehydrogenase
MVRPGQPKSQTSGKAAGSNAARHAISHAYLADEESLIEGLVGAARMSPAEAEKTHSMARRLVARMRASEEHRRGIDAFTQRYALSSEEGVMLMCLAEALLRVPDADTADRLIRDKIAGREWDRHRGSSESLFVNASTWALMFAGRLVDFDTAQWNFDNIWRRLLGRLGEPVIRQAVTQAVRMLGRHFVLGRTIEEALEESREEAGAGARFSFDMLGEAAYTREDAERYLQNYRHAVRVIGRTGVAGEPVITRPGISIKLTALHPRFDWVKRERVLRELLPPLAGLVSEARAANLPVTIDAEEAERLDLTLDLFEALSDRPELRSWEGLGLAVQAYQKRALPVIDWLGGVALRQQRRIPIRLVKGAYWDTEIKRGQELGLSDYPVYTRKSATDASYLAAARRLLAGSEAFYPQFATHNAMTLAAVETFAGKNRAFEFQRLHGMGEALYDLYGENPDAAPVRIYAPVGSHEDLLAYLVRRLLENGANTSFVNRLANDEAPIEDIIADPVARLASAAPKRNPRISKPQFLYPGRKNSAGLMLSDPEVTAPLLASMHTALRRTQTSHPIINGKEARRRTRVLTNPADRSERIGEASEATAEDVRAALDSAADAQGEWDRRGGAARSVLLERAADLFEASRPLLMGLLVREAGRTVGNAQNELREAVDLLRYYAREARTRFETSFVLPGPAGERNELTLHGRGVFAAIAPWNFPLSIFTGQVAGALAAGNTVLAKPAEQTPLVAAASVRLLHQAGIPPDVLHLLPGDGARIGKAMFPDPRLAGVVFTGSTETASAIHRALADRKPPLAALIAETGGLNAMVVDSTALPEQVARDVLASAFDSAGQRCSSLRILFLQDDVADRMEKIILGALDELSIGDPFDLATDIGPVIDEDARTNLARHAARMRKEAQLLRALLLGPAHETGTFFPPHVFRLDRAAHLKREVFGPILHVVRYSADRLDAVCDAINASGYGLTLGLHSRITSTAQYLRERVRVGNFYVNRNQIGAVVEGQPFGGERLSGTGPKAGGPHYLPHFAVERTYTVNTAAAGGNTALLTLDEA